MMAGKIATPRETMLYLTLKVKGSELLFKNGNKIVERGSLSKVKSLFLEAGFIEFVNEIERAERASVNRPIGLSNLANEVYGMTADERAMAILDPNDRKQYFSNLSDKRKIALKTNLMKRGNVDTLKLETNKLKG